jgi:alkylhydroperoxidase family enzyme
MSWIEIVNESEASGALKELYEEIVRRRGKLSNIMRVQGFSDRDILDIVLVVAYFNLVNRIASGLGVECTQEETRGYKV